MTDNGMGIPEDRLPRLFEVYMQVNTPEKSQGGLGVGLAIAKRIVELHGGSIQPHSGGPGRGTTLDGRAAPSTTICAGLMERR